MGLGSTVVSRRRRRWSFRRFLGATVPLVFLLLAVPACKHVRPWQRERLASPALQFEMAPAATAQTDSIREITEGNTFPSAGPGSAGAGCGCH